MASTNVDPYESYLSDPKKMENTVSGLRNAVNTLPKNVRKILRYLAQDSLDPYNPVSVVCAFVDSLDAYLKNRKIGDYPYLSNEVRWRTVVCSDERESPKIFKGDLFNRIGERMNGSKAGGPNFTEMNEFIKELTKAGVLYRSQEPHEEAIYTLTPEASEALRVLKSIREFPWSYPINIMPDGRPLITDDEKNSKFFPKYKSNFLQLEMDIIEGQKTDLIKLNVSENSLGL